VDGLIKVHHKDCGGHVGYIKDDNKPKSDTENFWYLNMTHPNPCDKIRLGCLKCGGYITRRRELTL
jgi:hypothetical protein